MIKNKVVNLGCMSVILVTSKGEIIPIAVDTADMPKINEYSTVGIMRLQSGDKYAYVYKKDSGVVKQFYLHRVVLGVDNMLGGVVDHISGATLDNRSENLRYVTQMENQQNRSGVTKRSSTSRRNVYKSGDKFYVSMNVGGKRNYFGRFDTVDGADRVAREMRSKLMRYSNREAA